MNKHEETMHISQKEFDRINRLLSIKSLEEMTDDQLKSLGAYPNSCEGLFYVEFDDGSSLNYDLCSGSHNYFDDVTWTSADGSMDAFLDCTYSLEDFEFKIENELYIVKIIKE